MQLITSIPVDTFDGTNTKRTPLHYACAAGRYSAAKLLLEKGASLTSKDQNGWNAFHHAAAGGCEEFIAEQGKASLKSIDEPDSSGLTPLREFAIVNPINSFKIYPFAKVMPSV